MLAWRALAVTVAAAGLALRWSELGMYGLSNDEAWVGLATRVEGLAQAHLAIAMTPVGWAALVKLASIVAGPSEFALRLVPFTFGTLTMAIAWRAGRRFAGHELGGVLALAVVAFDPLGIVYARILKQYTAEAFFALLAIDRAAAWAARPRRRTLVGLALVLSLGTLFANAQLFLGPPICAALLVVAACRRDRRALADVVAVSVVIGIADLLFYRFVLAPRLPVADAYWSRQVYLPPEPLAAVRIAWERLGVSLRPALGTIGFPTGMAALALASLRPRARPTGLVVALLLGELAVLSMLRDVAVSQPRILLFLTTTLSAFAGAASATLLVRVATSPAGRVVAAVALTLVLWDFARIHSWRVLSHATLVEDAGPLVRDFERDAGPGDALLLHQKTLFIYGYYQHATPVLDPIWLSVGYLPRVSDPRVTVVNERTMEERARAALTHSARVWLIGSRLVAPDERRIRATLEPVATIVREQRRVGALGLVLERRPAAGP